MFEIFQEEKIVTICMLVFFVTSLFLRFLLGSLYQSMIRETDNMATTKNKLLKQCKLKFAHCYQLNDGVANIPIFVDKFLNRLTIGPLSFVTMYHLSGQFMLLSVVSSGIGICRSILHGKMLGEVLPFYIVSFLGLYLYFSISTVIDIKGKKRILKINLVDYLENHLSSRISTTEKDMKMLFENETTYAGYRRARQNREKQMLEWTPIGNQNSIVGEKEIYAEKNKEQERTVQEELHKQQIEGIEKAEQINEETITRETSKKEVTKEQVFTKAEEQELEELLKEFLTT